MTFIAQRAATGARAVQKVTVLRQCQIQPKMLKDAPEVLELISTFTAQVVRTWDQRVCYMGIWIDETSITRTTTKFMPLMCHHN
jgi:hypothetical protein